MTAPPPSGQSGVATRRAEAVCALLRTLGIRIMPKNKLKKAKKATRSRPSDNGSAATVGVKRRAGQVLRRLAADYPDAGCSLGHRTAFELLVATILSAQCTDERVNLVTKDLFQRYRGPAAFATAPIKELEEAVKSTGFYRNKAKNIKACATDLVDKHEGKVPPDMSALVDLAGVGRKTANVVLGTAFGLPTGVVGRHPRRPAEPPAGFDHREGPREGRTRPDGGSSQEGLDRLLAPHDPPRPRGLHRAEARL